ncbi:MAG: M23 family metallopeptidase [Gammaproteobacteria bacterium]|nr:M23 family metallopeptidase [Gammaproteobacteria bacterium]
MNIIFLGKFRGKPVRYQIGHSWQKLVCLSGILSVLAAVAGTGFWWGFTTKEILQLVDLEQKIAVEKVLIAETRMNAQSDLDALAAHIGQMQANVTRLNALGQRLVTIAKLDSDEFDFESKPAYGGPSEPENTASIDINTVLSDLNEQLLSRQQQLSLLEDVIMRSELMREARPTGRPISKGWISSYYGKRTDPFSGKLEMHKGMDFAGKKGSDVIAVASGVVTWSGARYGYGNLVEINHGNGYVTRYGHNEEILVKAGDSVVRGQTISKMGSTGRSTGPHVHYEVLLKDRQVDPIRFVQSKAS